MPAVLLLYFEAGHFECTQAGQLRLKLAKIHYSHLFKLDRFGAKKLLAVARLMHRLLPWNSRTAKLGTLSKSKRDLK